MSTDIQKIIDAEFTEIINDKVDAVIERVIEESTSEPVAAISQSPVEDLKDLPSTEITAATAVEEVKMSRKDRRAQEAWDRRAPSRLLKQKKQAMIRKRREDVAARVSHQVEASRARALARKTKPTE